MPPGLGPAVVDHRMFALYSALLDCSPATLDDLEQVFSWGRPALCSTLGRLLDLKLVRKLPTGRGFAPNRPDAAAAQAVNALESRVRVLRRKAEQIRGDLEPLMPAYLAADARRAQRGDALDLLADQERVEAVLDEAAALCRTRMLAVRIEAPAAQDHHERWFARDRALLDRGVAVRVLCPPRPDEVTADYAARVTEAGAHLRTVRELASRFVVFDDDVALILCDGEPRGPAGVVVRDTGLVAFLHDLFDHFWEGGTEWADDHRPAERPRLTDATKHSILRLLVQGHRDEAIARRLGISVRTCRRHIAEIMEMSGADSRFQAGYLLAGRQLLDAAE
ncbi:helix-turn-helix transcriptional regulator [Streptomyces pratensis]|uniref:helix-turn-helix transcriptional regulator n=1 Tax=Streptomyces pratensis TaxID=1169025 RepID=UPI003018A36B